LELLSKAIAYWVTQKEGDRIKFNRWMGVCWENPYSVITSRDSIQHSNHSGSFYRMWEFYQEKFERFYV